jgi:hypothetical protein
MRLSLVGRAGTRRSNERATDDLAYARWWCDQMSRFGTKRGLSGEAGPLTLRHHETASAQPSRAQLCAKELALRIEH